MFEWLKGFVEHLGDRDMTTYTQYIGDLEDFEKNDGKFQGLCPPSQDVVDADMKVLNTDTQWLDDFINTHSTDGLFTQEEIVDNLGEDELFIQELIDIRTRARADETITNEAGGKQSRIDTRFDLLPAEIHDMVGQVLAHGEHKYGEGNWMKLPISDHIGHALNHISKYRLHKDTNDLTHAIVRLYFAAHLQHDGVL